LKLLSFLELAKRICQTFESCIFILHSVDIDKLFCWEYNYIWLFT